MTQEHVNSSAELETNFNFYRQQFPDYGIEAEGAFELRDFQRIVDDPNTTQLTITVEEQTRTVPLTTPLTNRDNWFNVPFYQRYAGTDAPLTHYNHLASLYARDPAAYLEAVGHSLWGVADEKGVLVLDHTDHETEQVNRDLIAMASALAIRFTPIEGPEGPATLHYHYASLGHNEEARDNANHSLHTLVEAYDSGLVQNAFPKDYPVTVSDVLTTEDTDRIWDFYEPAFDKLTENDPVKAGFTVAEFAELMQDPSCLKFVSRAEQDIVNLCLLMDVRDCSWMNQAYFRSHHPEQYNQGLVFCSPGVIANPNLARAASSLQTMGMVGRVIKLAGIEPVLTFACDTESNKQVPCLSQHALKGAGVMADYSRPVSHQLFRMLAVSHE